MEHDISFNTKSTLHTLFSVTGLKKEQRQGKVHQRIRSIPIVEKGENGRKKIYEPDRIYKDLGSTSPRNLQIAASPSPCGFRQSGP